MLLDSGKFTTIKSLCRGLLKEGTVFRAIPIATSRLHCVALEKHYHNVRIPSSLRVRTVFNPNYVIKRFTSRNNKDGTLDRLTFDSVCTETLDSLSEYFEELIESVPHLKNGDVTYSDGVLTVHLGKNHGTYVINRQTPNLQIWLSSPTSGPKRYDFVSGTWIYKHDKTTLHSLLEKEIKEIVNQDVHFISKCLHSKPTI